MVGWGRTEHGVAQTPSLLQVSEMMHYDESTTLSQASDLPVKLLNKSMVLISFQEVKVQVISAEKCQSWFKQAHRWECSLFASWLPSLSCSFSSVSWPQSSSIICWRSNARNVRLFMDHKTHFYRSLKFSVYLIIWLQERENIPGELPVCGIWRRGARQLSGRQRESSGCAN